jgi:lactoylglutathione lyase
VWVDGPDGAWEIYTVLEDSDTFGISSEHAHNAQITDDALCCGSMPESAARCC